MSLRRVLLLLCDERGTRTRMMRFYFEQAIDTTSCIYDKLLPNIVHVSCVMCSCMFILKFTFCVVCCCCSSMLPWSPPVKKKALFFATTSRHRLLVGAHRYRPRVEKTYHKIPKTKQNKPSTHSKSKPVWNCVVQVQEPWLEEEEESERINYTLYLVANISQ